MVPFTVSADNSMFSVYEFLSNHLDTASIKENEDGIHVVHLQEEHGYVQSLVVLAQKDCASCQDTLYF